MFARICSVFFLFVALPFLAAAHPTAINARGGAPSGPVTNQCNTGNVSCCNQLQKAGESGLTGILGLLGAAVTDPQAMLGVNCSPVSVFGGGLGSSCTANPVCCENNAVGGLIGIGCVPIQLSL